ncbi:MAG TPA: NAD-dependent epimerase/dehydratase family protein [Thermomicrobiaceae bacterium]|nr:NAD-dependent epimerase/dehydratase family protein [Thermomicrobiaceae bacterium]
MDTTRKSRNRHDRDLTGSDSAPAGDATHTAAPSPDAIGEPVERPAVEASAAGRGVIEWPDRKPASPLWTPRRRCLVTGSAGFIGSRLARRLLDDGWQVTGVDALTDSYDISEKAARAVELARHPRYQHVYGDLVDLSLDSLLRGVEVVFHLAGRPGVRPSFSLEQRYRHDNVDATVRLVDASRASASVRRLVYASSSSIYGNAALPFREDTPPAPISPYGRTKLEAERYCLEESGPSLGCVALRYFTVYGPGQRPDLALRRFAEAALLDRPLHLFGDGRQSRDFTYVDDIVEATYRAAEIPTAGIAINVGGGSRVSLLQVFTLLEELVGRPLRVEVEPVAPGDVRHTAADLSRARQILEFVPRTSFAEGFAQEVEWVRRRIQDMGGDAHAIVA